MAGGPLTPHSTILGDATYCITGGLGELGLRVAQKLVEQGAKNLLLLGRNGVTKDSQTEAIKALQAIGANVKVMKADISRWPELNQAWTMAQMELPPIRGVIHAAGVLDDGLLQNQSWSDFVKVMRPKVQGGWNLHRVTQEQELDFFICFSSATSLFGSAAQSNYATAFLDSLCAYRNQLGLPGLALNWGPWSEVGMAVTLAGKLAQVGWKLIPPAQALDVLTSSLTKQGQQGVLALNWEILNDRLSPKERAFFNPVLPVGLTPPPAQESISAIAPVIIPNQ
ncbi:MAG: SDR family NAD(P)-dependent oxidoreductase [Synechococcaceae cyanobacterium RL_1_2]|nr:SDR family NAD(P)-dependent oxidoreductase [Synechococcaceae cyanobacterium RL_1_2]